MKEQYSTQQLNSHLPEVLKQIEQGNSIEITQEGKPFAYILSASEYQRLTAPKSSFWESLYVPLVMAAISNWQEQRLYLALDTTVLWNR